jgi:hypothetical protein
MLSLICLNDNCFKTVCGHKRELMAVLIVTPHTYSYEHFPTGHNSYSVITELWVTLSTRKV